jgi:Xaa-Pro dipeptidase
MLDELYSDHLRTQRQRMDDALAASRFEAVAIYAGTARMQFLDDQPYPFKVNPHFRVWTPLADPLNCWIVYRPGQRLKLIFWQPVDYWHKPPSAPAGYWTSHFDVEVIRESLEAKTHVTGLRDCAFIGEWRDEFAQWGFKQMNPQNLLDRLHFPRAIKTPYEVECMRRASRAGAIGHRAAEAAFREGASEYGIHLEYLRATQHSENELPYPSIVALNENCGVLHYQHQERAAPTQRYSFLIDAGAQFAGYASDITRTYSWADDEFDTLIQEMHKLQLSLCSQVRDGVDYASIHLDTHMRIGNLLHDAGLITSSGSDALESGLTSIFFPHGIGHLLGLQVHDVAGFMSSPDGSTKDKPAGHPYLRLTRTLSTGFVVTIEPGIYFIDLLLDQARGSALSKQVNWSAVERFKPCGGIRIEDDVLCTDSAPENLTREAFAACI